MNLLAVLFLTLHIFPKGGFNKVESFTINAQSSLTKQERRFDTMRQRCQHSLPKTSSGTSTIALRQSGGDVSSNDTKKKLLREMIAEFVGTFLIVQLGCGVVCAAIFESAQAGLWQIAAVWSIAVTLAISVTGSISGAHLNPAITIALATFRDFEWGKVFPFVVAQLFGAIAAAATNLSLFHSSIAKFESASNIVRGTRASIESAKAFGEYWSVSSWQSAFLAEAYGTAILALVIFSLTNSKNETTAKNPILIPPLIGATVGALISGIAPLTQAGFNPARDFGPRLVALLGGWGGIAMQGWWVYILAPIVGALVGAFIAEKVLYK